MNSLEIKAAAKINLSLSVTGIRGDGYHNIDTVMQSVSLYDTLTVSRADKITVECGEMSGERNIAFKAAKLFFEHTGICGGAFIKIEKNIPDGAGLGGGSADAAAVLAGLDRIYNTGLSYETLSGLAARLGADVPFMLRGESHGNRRSFRAASRPSRLLYYYSEKRAKAVHRRNVFGA